MLSLLARMIVNYDGNGDQSPFGRGAQALAMPHRVRIIYLYHEAAPAFAGFTATGTGIAVLG
ncbi:MAG: hypothetical protein ABR578_00205 [Chromatocurvus sp.]